MGRQIRKERKKTSLTDMLTRSNTGKHELAKKGDVVVGRSGTRYKMVNHSGTLRRLTPKAESKKGSRHQTARKRKLENIRKASE